MPVRAVLPEPVTPQPRQPLAVSLPALRRRAGYAGPPIPLTGMDAAVTDEARRRARSVDDAGADDESA